MSARFADGKERTSTIQYEAIRSRARADLIVLTRRGDPDLLLWEHSDRTARSAQQIAKLPEARAESPDEMAIVAAALYHDAGWVLRLKEEEIGRDEVFLRQPSETHFEQAAVLLRKRLADLLPPDSLARASEAVRSLGDRTIESIEGWVVGDADNLDEFGILSLWSTVRRGVVDGKAVQAAIDTWHRRKEYRFWDARLNDSFKFASVRSLAEQRLKKFERLMQELEEQHRGADFVTGGVDETPDRATAFSPS